MSETNPLEVTFTLPNEQLASWLDKMIATSGMSPDQWFAQLIRDDRRSAAQQATGRLNDLLGRIQADSSTEAFDADSIDYTGRKVPPRPASARAVRGSSRWRTR